MQTIVQQFLSFNRESHINFIKKKTVASIHVAVMMMMFVFVVLFTAIVFFEEYRDFDNEAEVIQKTFIKNQKETIVFDTQRVLQFITYMYNTRDTSKDEEELKRQTIDAIEQLYGRQDGTGYIFIYDFNGTVLSDPVQRQNIGKNLYATEDANGIKVIEELINVSRRADGGYVEYLWLKPTTNALSPKISYAKSFEPWRWMVGTGVYLDEVEMHITEQRSALKQRLNRYLMDSVFLLAVLLIVGIVGIVVANNILKREIDIFTEFFHKAATSYVVINVKNIRLSEFKNMVTYINAMIEVIHHRTQTLKELNATLESKVEQKTKDLSEKNRLLEEEKNFSHSLVQAQDSFIKHAIHEINTPLAVIMTHIDLFKMKEGKNRYLTKIEAASKMISNIYEDLSYMVKKNRFDYVKKYLNVSAFLEERIDFFADIAKGNQHGILSEIQDDIRLYFSPEELQRLIDNNLSNAIKYANKGTDVKVVLKTEGQNIVLQFISISPKIKDTEGIFKAFWRENDVRGGFGLGLEIVYTICQKEKVKIEVESDEEMTLFTYKFEKES